MLNYTAFLFVCLFSVAMLTGMGTVPAPVDCTTYLYNSQVEELLLNQFNDACSFKQTQDQNGNFIRTPITKSKECVDDYLKGARCFAYSDSLRNK